MNNKYLEANVLGVATYIDKYIANNDCLYFCSSFKNATSVKGAQAGFLAGHTWHINEKKYERSSSLNYKTHIAQVSNNIYHGLVYVESFFNAQQRAKVSIVFGDKKEEIRTTMFKKLRQYSNIPLISDWQDFLVDNLLLDSAVQLECFGYEFAYEIVLPSDESVYSLVMDNIDYLKDLVELKNGNIK